MSDQKNNAKKLTVVSLVLMIFTSVYGFNNIPRSFYKMGYAAIPWYILSAIVFFVPFALMIAEFGSAFKDEKGGIYSWMEKSMGAKYAFIGTFMWYASNLVWMVSVAPGLWVPLSNAIFGKDTSQSWAIFGQGLAGAKTLGILGILWILLVTFVSTKGLDKIKKVTSVGGTAVAIVNVLVWITAIVVLIANKGHLAQPIEGLQSFTTSPNKDFTGGLASLAFIVYALFAYGGIEVVGGLVDQTDNPKKTFPKGILLSAAIISVGYAAGILLVGIFTNFNQIMSTKGVHIGNVSYLVMSNLGYSLGISFGASEATATAMAHGVARFFGLSMFLALVGAFFTLSYAPLKQLIEGTPKKLWPGKFGELNKDNMPVNAMWVQAIIVCIIIGITSFGGSGVDAFFQLLTNMSNVALTIPYMFIAGVFPAFKRKQEIVKPFEVFKTQKSANIWTAIVVLTVGFANFFTVIQPAIQDHDMVTTIESIIGPVVFGLVAWAMHRSYEKKFGKSQGQDIAS